MPIQKHNTASLHLKPLAGESQRPAVLRHHPHHVVRRAGRVVTRFENSCWLCIAAAPAQVCAAIITPLRPARNSGFGGTSLPALRVRGTSRTLTFSPAQLQVQLDILPPALSFHNPQQSSPHPLHRVSWSGRQSDQLIRVGCHVIQEPDIDRWSALDKQLTWPCPHHSRFDPRPSRRSPYEDTHRDGQHYPWLGARDCLTAAASLADSGATTTGHLDS